MKKLNKKEKKHFEKFFVEIFNVLGFLGLTAFALVGLVMWNSLRGIPIIENILVSSVILFIFISFLFTKRMF